MGIQAELHIKTDYTGRSAVLTCRLLTSSSFSQRACLKGVSENGRVRLGQEAPSSPLASSYEHVWYHLYTYLYITHYTYTGSSFTHDHPA